MKIPANPEEAHASFQFGRAVMKGLQALQATVNRIVPAPAAATARPRAIAADCAKPDGISENRPSNSSAHA